MEQTVTGMFLCEARTWKASAAVVVVLPTPPFPTVKPSRVSAAGQSAFANFSLLFDLRGGSATSLALRPPKTTAPNFPNKSAPSRGFPGSGPNNLGNRGNLRFRNTSAFLAACDCLRHRGQLSGAVTARFKTTAPSRISGADCRSDSRLRTASFNENVSGVVTSRISAARELKASFTCWTVARQRSRKGFARLVIRPPKRCASKASRLEATSRKSRKR